MALTPKISTTLAALLVLSAVAIAAVLGERARESATMEKLTPVCPLDADPETQHRYAQCPKRVVTPQSWGVERIAPKK